MEIQMAGRAGEKSSLSGISIVYQFYLFALVSTCILPFMM